jgi:hypothetical protein
MSESESLRPLLIRIREQNKRSPFSNRVSEVRVLPGAWRIWPEQEIFDLLKSAGDRSAAKSRIFQAWEPQGSPKEPANHALHRNRKAELSDLTCRREW